MQWFETKISTTFRHYLLIKWWNYHDAAFTYLFIPLHNLINSLTIFSIWLDRGVKMAKWCSRQSRDKKLRKMCPTLNVTKPLSSTPMWLSSAFKLNLSQKNIWRIDYAGLKRLNNPIMMKLLTLLFFMKLFSKDLIRRGWGRWPQLPWRQHWSRWSRRRNILTERSLSASNLSKHHHQ